MSLPNIFSKEVSDNIIERINNLTPATQPKWGKMSVAQMLAHCNVTYEMTYENIHPKPNAFMRFILKTLVKNKVVNEAPTSKITEQRLSLSLKKQKILKLKSSALLTILQGHNNQAKIPLTIKNHIPLED